MLQCEDCEHFRRDVDGSPRLQCDPFTNIKEPQCLIKWQLIQLTVISKSHQATLDMHKRLAPLQEKMFKYMEREIEDVEEGESWKLENLDDDDDDDDPFHV